MISVIIPSRNEPYLQKTILDLLKKAKEDIEIIVGYIYLITNKVNGKQYVGQTISNVKQRWSQHVHNSKRGKNYPLYSAISKYGRDNFEISILAKVDSIQTLNFLEEILINKMCSTVPLGYNIRGGGGNGRLHESTRKKLSIIHTGKQGIPHTEEFKRRLGRRSLGNKYALGRKQSNKERQKHKVIAFGYKRGINGQFIKKQ